MAIPPKFDNGEEFVHGLGDVPLSRIVFDPWPGTATEQDLIDFVDHDDKRLVELIDGTLVEKVVGSWESIIAALIVRAILNFVSPRKLGIVGGEAFPTRTTPGRVRIPDVSFVSFDRLPGRKVSRESINPISPDLAIEVLSESNTHREIDQKLKEFFLSGTRLAWIVDPKSQSVEVYITEDAPNQTLAIGDSLDGGSVLPGFELSLKEIFETY
jgi:Uma2 family endonuclease